jgi:hypothetical protein
LVYHFAGGYPFARGSSPNNFKKTIIQQKYAANKPPEINRFKMPVNYVEIPVFK